MNGVDIGDQYRSDQSVKHRICKGPWRAIAWGFLLEVIILNTFLLQRWGQPCWDRCESLHAWKQRLCDKLIARYGQEASLRQRSRSGDNFTPIPQHQRVQRKSNCACHACKGLRFNEPRKKRMPLGRASQDHINRQKPHFSRSGCGTYNVALCNSQYCWDFYHGLI